MSGRMEKVEGDGNGGTSGCVVVWGGSVDISFVVRKGKAIDGKNIANAKFSSVRYPYCASM